MVVARKHQENVDRCVKEMPPKDVRLNNIITMGIGFSAMTRLFKKGSKKNLHKSILEVAKELFEAKSKEDYDRIHSKFCNDKVGKIKLAKGGTAKYGEIAKTLDVVMRVAVYYAHLPDCRRACKLTEWLNAAVDTKMTDYLNRYLRKKHSKERLKTATNVKDEKEYRRIQEVVKDFIREKHPDKISPAQFDDIYWRCLNKKP